MKKNLSLLLILFVNHVFSQSNIIGLYGECDGAYSIYACQQLLLQKDSTFKYYSLFHLSGWLISEGNWKFVNDTLILNSNNPLNRPDYHLAGRSSSDSLNIYIHSDEGALPYVNVSIDSITYLTNQEGLTKIPKNKNEVLLITYVGHLLERIKLDPDINNADTLKLKLYTGLKVGNLFLNEKWLINEEKVFHTPDSLNNFDSSGYFLKVPETELKYSEDY